VEGGRLTLDAVVLSPDGKRRIVASGATEVADAIPLGHRVAADLLAQGAADLIAASHDS
jgi:porphobilinogen deaminase